MKTLVVYYTSTRESAGSKSKKEKKDLKKSKKTLDKAKLLRYNNQAFTPQGRARNVP